MVSIASIMSVLLAAVMQTLLAAQAGQPAQETLVSVEGPIRYAGRYDMATGTLRPGAAGQIDASAADVPGGAGPVVILYDNSATNGAASLTNQTTQYSMDWGIPTFPGCSVRVTEVRIGYATSITTGTIGLHVRLHDGAAGFGSKGYVYPAGDLLLTGLPPSTGGFQGYFLDVVLAAPLELTSGPLGWSYSSLQGGTGPLTVGPPNGAGVVNAIDRYMESTGAYVGTFQLPSFKSSFVCRLKGTINAVCCDDQAAVFDDQGNLVLPPDADPDAPVSDEIDVDEDLGAVADLYPDLVTKTDLWYPDFPCDPSIGGEVPPEADPDLDKALKDAGILNVTADEMATSLANWESAISAKTGMEDPAFKTVNPVKNAPYMPPLVAHAPTPGECYVLGGRDCIFVHGLRPEHIIDRLSNVPGADAQWIEPTVFPGSIQNPEFYNPGGYYKSIANASWASHINRYFTSKGIKNRYLVVSYSCSDRLEVAVHSVLTQISDAMRFGTGVKDPLHPFGPPPLDFGTPSFVCISQSTGGPVTDVAMAAAKLVDDLDAGFIPQHCKAHIAMHGAFSGSRWATVAVVLSGFIQGVIPPQWLCPLAIKVLNQLNLYPASGMGFNCGLAFTTIASSILVDLCPIVMQLKWGGLIASTPVKTVTVVGGHPSFLAPFKYIFHEGLDDGVVTINSQVANFNSVLFWPSGYVPNILALIWRLKVYDMGVAKLSSARAVGYFIDQVVDQVLHPNVFFPIFVAAGAIPYVSPTGMLQPVGLPLKLSPYDTTARYPNHYSFLQSASEHEASVFGTSMNYMPTNDTGVNYEETRVITDSSIYDPYDMVYQGDNEPLLTLGLEPQVRLSLRGRYFSYTKLNGKPGKLWRWRRYYALLDNTQSLVEMDYAYKYLLTNPGVVTPCSPTWLQVGCASDGTFGPPVLDGTGTMVAGSLNFLDLSSASPNHAVMMFVSSGPLTTVHLKCVTLCVPLSMPAPLLQTTLSTDAAGKVLIPFICPAGIPSKTKIYIQCLIVDPGSECGLSVSNVLCVMTP
jgi:hypothetical protein